MEGQTNTKERNSNGFYRHWSWMKLGSMKGVSSWEPGLGKFFEDEFTLGERVASAYDDESVWGSNGIILMMAAPGAPWEENSSGRTN